MKKTDRILLMKKDRASYLILGLLIAFCSADTTAAVLKDHGSLTVVSRDLAAGEPGELVLSYRAPNKGLPVGYRVWIELPTGWSNTIGCPRVDQGVAWQNDEKNNDGYFEARNYPDGITIRHEVGRNTDILGSGSRFAQILSFQVQGQDMKAGEEIHFIFRHHVIDDRPYAPFVAGSGTISWIVVSADEDLPDHNPVLAQASPGKPRDYAVQSVGLEVRAGKPSRIEVALPSRAAAGDKISVRVRLLDAHFNLDKRWQAPVRLTATGPIKGLASEVMAGANGVAETEAVVTGPGIVRVRVRAEGLSEAISNPLEVTALEPEYKIYWGDVHSHSQLSQDGMGVEPFKYGRDASSLDFYALTEHGRHVTSDEWIQITRTVEQYNHSGRFVTLLAIEDSAIQPSGHFNLYFKEKEAPLLMPDQLGELAELYGDLDPLSVQHHTGIMWKVDLPAFIAWAVPIFNRFLGPVVDWSAFPDAERTAIEIYSQHGSSEVYDPTDPLAYENCDLTLTSDEKTFGQCTTGASTPGPHYARDGWAAGYVMGTVSGSDDHRAQPGKRGGGLSAVLAKDLSRQAIFDAIQQRRTYATTGDRIILDFKINGRQMGSVIEATSPIKVQFHATGTAPINELKILCYNWEDKEWRAVVDQSPGRESADVDETIETRVPCVCYVRLTQDTLVNKRPVRAWSSPIWVGTPPSITTKHK